MSRLRLLLLSLLTLAAAGQPIPAWACSCGWDDGRFLIEDRGEVPANARGVVWWGAFHGEDRKLRLPTTAELRVERWQGGLFLPVEHTIEPLTPPGPKTDDGPTLFLLVPRQGMKAGQVYRFSRVAEVTQGEPPEPTQSVEVTVGETAFDRKVAIELRAEALGKDTIGTTTLAGSCQTEIEAARARIELVWPGPAEKWRPSLFFLTTVDGQPWRPTESLCHQVPPGSSWQGPGRELLFATCALGEYGIRPALSLKEGEHRVEMKVWLPGTEAVATATTTVSLRCQ